MKRTAEIALDTTKKVKVKKPGRELDALIAEKVMGWRRSKPGCDDRVSFCGCDDTRELPSYSTDIAAAWEVVEKLMTIPIPKDWEDCFSSCFTFFLRRKNALWEAGWSGAYYAEEHVSESESAPHAICLAALKAMP